MEKDEGFVIPENSIEILEIMIGDEIRQFRYVTKLTENGKSVDRSTVIIDGVPRAYEFCSVFKTTSYGERVEKYVQTHPRCFGIIVFVDETLRTN